MLTSKQISSQYKVSLRTAQRWIKQGFNEAVCNDDNKRHETTKDDANDRILKLLETQNKLMQTMLDLMIEIKNDRSATQNDKVVATANTNEALAFKAINSNLSYKQATEYDTVATDSDTKRQSLCLRLPSVAPSVVLTKEKKEEKGKEKFPLIYPPYKEKEKEERKETINPIIPFAEERTTNTDAAEDKKTKTSSQYSSDFEEFWNVYPRTPNSSKQKAYKAFSNLKKKTALNFETLLVAVENYKKTKSVHQGYIKHASTFLNDNPFENELLTAKNVTSYKTPKENKQDIVNRIIDLHNQLTRLENIAKAGDAYIEGYGFKGIEDIDNKCILIRQELSSLNTKVA